MGGIAVRDAPRVRAASREVVVVVVMMMLRMLLDVDVHTTVEPQTVAATNAAAARTASKRAHTTGAPCQWLSSSLR